MKRYSLALISLLILGCGGGGGSSSSTTQTQTIKVIDAYVVGAEVCDEANNCKITDINGSVNGNFSGKLRSTGGFIDDNFNGIKDSGEVDAPNLYAPAGASVITTATTLVAMEVDIEKLSKLLGVSKDAILHEDPVVTKNLELFKALSALYYVVEDEDKINDFIELLNNLNLDQPSDLPEFDNTQPNIYNLIKVVAPENIDRIDAIKNITSTDITEISNQIGKIREGANNIGQGGSGGAGGAGGSGGDGGTGGSGGAGGTGGSGGTSSGGGSDLPNMGEGSGGSGGSSSGGGNSNLPDYGSNNSALIPTNNEYNPEAVPPPVKYFIRFDSLDRIEEVNKINDKKFSLKNNLFVKDDINITTIFDINATEVFKDVSYNVDGNLNGGVFINLKDLNSTNEINFSIKNVSYNIMQGELVSSDFTNVEVNSTESNYTVVDTTYPQYDINFSKILKNYNESDFNITNHTYSFYIDYNISDTILKLEGKYIVTTSTPIYISLEDDRFLVYKDKDFNITIGSTNVYGSCSTNDSTINCELNGSNSIFLSGKLTSYGDKTLEVTVVDSYTSDTKTVHLYAANEPKYQIITNWGVDNNYSGRGLFIEKSTFDSVSIDVNSSKDDVDAAYVPENNVTAYACDETDHSKCLKIIFDSNKYDSNDVFAIKRRDSNKIAIFGVFEVDQSNNTFYFK